MKYQERVIDTASQLSCGNCTYFHDRALYEGSPCVDLGGQPHDKICRRYVYDIGRLSEGKRISLLAALATLQRGKISAADLRGLLYNSENLRGKTAFGSRWVMSFGKKPYEQNIILTLIGHRPGSNKYIFLTPSGGVGLMALEHLTPYDETALVESSFFPIDEPPSKKEQLAKIETKIGSYRLRGDDNDDAPDSPTETEEAPKRKAGRPPKESSAKKRSTKKAAGPAKPTKKAAGKNAR